MNAQQDVLTLEEMLGADDTQYCTVPVPGFSKPFRLGSLSAVEFIDFLEKREAATGRAKRLLGIELIVKSVVDGNGNRVGNDALGESLLKKNQKTVGLLVDAVMELNGLNDKAKNA